MTNIFISYSRKDKKFAEKLVGRFVDQQVDVWIDWEDIQPSTDWWQEIERGIETSDVLVFLVSPDSVASQVCRKEVDHAVANGKRLIPVVVREVDPQDVPAVISKLNWIFFRKNDDFDVSFTNLDIAIHTDFEWVRVHNEVQVKALKWKRTAYDKSLLLFGKELNDVERQFQAVGDREPIPTDLQREYILKSRNFVNYQRRLLFFITSVVVIVLLSFLTFNPIRGAVLRWRVRELGDTAFIKDGDAVIGNNKLAETENALPEQIKHLDDFRIEIFEVTYYRYLLCVSAGECSPANGQFDEKLDANKPVVQVTVVQAMTFCNWIGRRLPTELEWERAARYTDGRSWPWREAEPPVDETYAILNYERANADMVTTQEVGKAAKGVSEEGVYDLIGNVWEWTCTPTSAEPDTCWMDSSSPPVSKTFIIRGGGANIPPGQFVLSAYRESAEWDYSLGRFIGFRCVDVP